MDLRGEDEETLRDLCSEAAEWLVEADFFLFCTGAGWSADSGLPVYKDIADFPLYRDLNLSYKDVSQPHWLVSKPEMFYGFWGSNFNNYRNAVHHKGYQIVNSWRSNFFSKISASSATQSEGWMSELLQKQSDNFKEHKERHYDPCLLNLDPSQSEVPALQFFNYTSNVDAHALRVFPKNEVFQIHGDTETWQCSSFTHTQARKKYDHVQCEKNGTWNLPQSFRFEINSDLTAPKTKSKSNETSSTSQQQQQDIEEEENWPKCVHCKKEYARPAVLMFEDFDCMPNYCEECRYQDWRKNVRELIGKYWESDRKLKIVILEIGCGKNVQTVRGQSKSWLRSLPKGSCKLIRVNLDFPEIEVDPDEDIPSSCILSIRGKGLPTVEIINEFVLQHLKEKDSK